MLEPTRESPQSVFLYFSAPLSTIQTLFFRKRSGSGARNFVDFNYPALINISTVL